MLLSKIFIGLASMASLALAAKNKTVSSDDPPPIEDLGTVLATHKNLTEYYNLVQKYPEVLMQLPSYDGVTIIAPSDAAFKNIPFTSLNHIWDPEDGNKTIPYLQYMILQGTVSTQGIKPGPTFIKKTILTNSTYTNVTDGQNIGVVKQPEDVVVFLTSLGTRCTVIEKDIRFAGGLIQIVDNLLIPPARLRVTAQTFGVNSFLGGLYAADIMPDLADEENVTIFAPRDTVMENVGGSLDNLEKMDAKQLARTMGYHVVPGQVIVSSDFKNGTYLETLARDINDNAQEVLLQQIGNNMYINSAQIVQPDILMANGIMHIINGVLNPAVVAPRPNPKLDKQPPVFNVSSVGDIPFTTAIPCTQGCPETATEEPVVTTSYHRTRTSKGVAPMITANIAGAAIGMVGLGAGLGWL